MPAALFGARTGNMFKNHTVEEPYPVSITKALLAKWNGEVRVWDQPCSAIEGAIVIDSITRPLRAKVVEEQLDLYGSTPQRVRIRYGRGKEGWVIYPMVKRPASNSAGK